MNQNTREYAVMCEICNGKGYNRFWRVFWWRKKKCENCKGKGFYMVTRPVMVIRSPRTIRGPIRPTTAPAPQRKQEDSSSSDLLTGVLIGSMLNSAPTKAEPEPDTIKPGGGQFGGAGASGSWESKEDSSPDTSDTADTDTDPDTSSGEY